MILVNKPLLIAALQQCMGDPALLSDLESQGAVDEEFDSSEIEEMTNALVDLHEGKDVSERFKEAIEETVAQFDADLAGELEVSRVAAKHGYGFFKR